MIERREFEQYSAALSVNADMATEELRKHLATLSGASDKQLSGVLKEMMPELVGKYGKRAAQAAVEFYSNQRSAMKAPGDYQPQAFDEVDNAAVVRPIDPTIKEANSRDSLASLLSGQTIRHVNGMADTTLLENARRDPARPKWALVPHIGACGFCLLIASREFDYATKEKVARHNGCKCTVAVDFSKNPGVQGYNPGEYRKLYEDVERDIRPKTQAAWDAMSEDERKRWKTISTFHRRQLIAEIDRRMAVTSVD